MATYSEVNEVLPIAGIIRLYTTQNIFDGGSKWTTEASDEVKNSFLFFIPHGFTHDGTKDTFRFNFGLKYVNSTVKVPKGYVVHSGKHDLQQGETEKFWHLEPTEPPECKLVNDEVLRIPYLEVPDCGDPNHSYERRYFIPLPNNM